MALLKLFFEGILWFVLCKIQGRCLKEFTNMKYVSATLMETRFLCFVGKGGVRTDDEICCIGLYGCEGHPRENRN